jgi:plastocyanin
MVTIGNSMIDFQSYAGPGDTNLRNSEIQGYQPVSRIGEVVMNSFIDSYEFSSLDPSISAKQLTGDAGASDEKGAELKPHFHEWATVQPGMICVARKKRTAIFRQFVAAETAVPVIACAACLKKEDEDHWFFAGVARSKSVRNIDDGIGPSVDEFFTVSIGGMVTVLNTSGGPIHPGDQVSWTFSSKATHTAKRQKSGPRRIAITVASGPTSQLIGRALSFAKQGETLDILLKQ